MRWGWFGRKQRVDRFCFGGGGGLFPQRSEPAPLAEPGSYTVILKVGDDTFTQTLTVERSATAPSS